MAKILEALTLRIWYSVDAERRVQLFAEAERILIEEAPIVPLMHGLNMALVKPWVTRFPMAKVKWLYLKDVVLGPQ